MNSADKNPLLRRIFEQAADELSLPREPNVPHFIENDDLLTRWSLDQLRPQEHEQIVQHLSSCGSCRGELATLVKEGVLELPQKNEVERPRLNLMPAAEPITPASIRPWRRIGWGAAILAAAAAVVVAIVLSYPKPKPGSSNDLARARNELETGNPKGARLRLARLLDSGKLDSADREVAMGLFEKACVAQAKTDLEEGNFASVAQIDSDAADRGIKSGRLANLKIQADRNMTVQVAMAQKASLLDYGYMLDGSSPKDIPVPDERTQRVRHELKEAVEQDPENIDLLLNRGQFLLEWGPPQEAHDQFEKAHRIDSNNTLAILGMGLANYAMSEYKSALDRFDEVLQLDRKNVLANLNKGICLEKLGRHPEAVRFFEMTRRLTSDDNLKAKIERFLEHRP